MDTDSIQFIKNAEGELIYYAAGENTTQEQEEVMSLVENASANPKLNGKRYHLMNSSSDKYGFTYSVLYADNVVKQRMVSVFMIRIFDRSVQYFGRNCAELPDVKKDRRAHQ